MTNNPLTHSQNFLYSPALIRKLLGLTNISVDDIVIEIGPGKGIITKQLAKVCAMVIGIEFDVDLYKKLVIHFKDVCNVEIKYGDFLAYDLPDREYKIFANIPFSITSAILAHITTSAHLPIDAYLIMQEEAARRYAGAPYSKESLKSLLIKPQFEPSIIYRFANTDFMPVPQANIVLFHLHKRSFPLLEGENYKRYREFLCFLFSQSGKSVSERMRPIFSKLQIRRLAKEWGFTMENRPTDLSFDQWLGVFSFYLTGVPPEKKRSVEGAEQRLLQQQGQLVKIHRNRTQMPPQVGRRGTGRRYT